MPFGARGGSLIDLVPRPFTILKTTSQVDGMSASQSGASAARATVARELFDTYERCRMSEITSRRFTQADMLRWLEPLRAKSLFTVTPLGRSAEGRTISLLKLGHGKVRVMLWSQMHGDESTATMALLDILKFFVREREHTVTRTILEKLSLLIIPMLNPDGAERFQRRTAQAIDMNRDTLMLGTPEARILKETRDTYQPHFGFNLHDQDPRYTVGNSKNVSAIALLAPAFDESQSDNAVRLPAKKVAATIASVLHQFIPDNVSKYDDTFEPRAFGDNIQKWGTSTVLVESGGWPGDREKMFIRKLNYVALLTAMYSIATEEYQAADLEIYERLPSNTEFLYDIILRNARLTATSNISPVVVDIGINLDEEFDAERRSVEPIGKVVDIGDLRVYGAFQEADVRGALFTGAEIKMDEQVSLERIRPFLETNRAV